MGVIARVTKYVRYVDQGLYSLSTLSLSLLAPVFFEAEKSAQILYLISFLLLFLAVTTAVFVTQLLSMHDEKNETVERISKLFFESILIAFTLTAGWHFFVGLEDPFFFYFSYLFCSIDFLRRLFIRRGEVLWSLCLSMGFMLIIPVAYYLASNLDMNFWTVAFCLSLALILPFFCPYIRWFRYKIKYEKTFIINFVKNGILALISFLLVWAVTQGIFVVFYSAVENYIFVQQKLIFSILGFFNIIMLVQENKYQPLYAASFSRKDLVSIKDFDKKVNLESHYLLLLCVSIFFMLYFFDFDFYIHFLLFAIYRYFMSLSKRHVYYIRASGNYYYLVIANVLSICFLGFFYLLLKEFIDISYAVPICFILYAIFFISTLMLLKSRGNHAEHRGF